MTGSEQHQIFDFLAVIFKGTHSLRVFYTHSGTDSNRLLSQPHMLKHVRRHNARNLHVQRITQEETLSCFGLEGKDTERTR